MPDLLLSIRLAIRSGFRPFFVLSLGILAAVVGLAGLFSARHPSTVALDVGISFIRLVLPLVVFVLTHELLGREFERRYCLTSFAYPRSRDVWLLGRVAGVNVLSLALLAVLSVALVLLVLVARRVYEQETPVGLGWPFVLTMLFVAVDTMVVASVAALLTVTARTPGFVLVGTLGFVVIARSYATIVAMLSLDGSLVARLANPEAYRSSLSVLSFVLPDLAGLDVRMIALYDQMRLLPEDWGLRIAGAIFYALTLLGVSVLLLRRREFD